MLSPQKQLATWLSSRPWAAHEGKAAGHGYCAHQERPVTREGVLTRPGPRRAPRGRRPRTRAFPGSRGPAEPGRAIRLPGMQCRLGDADPVGHLANADARVAADLAGSLDQVPGPVGVEVAWDLYHRA